MIGAGVATVFAAPAVLTGIALYGVGDYEGAGSGYSIGLFAGGIDYSGNRRNINFHKSEFIDIQGDDYNQLGFGAFMGLDIGLTWSRTNTSIIR